MEAKDLLSERGSLYCLSNNQWKKLGVGDLNLTFNPHNPNELIFKLTVEKTGDIYVYQIKPKLKTKGPLSWVLKGLNTKEKEEQILAVRFSSVEISNEFKKHVEEASTRDGGASPPQPQHRPHTDTLTPDQIRSMLPKTPWNCPLCTTENTMKTRVCSVCRTPRPLINRLMSTTSIDSVGFLPPLSPRSNVPMGLLSPASYDRAIYGSEKGGSDTGSNSGSNRGSPTGSDASFDWSNVNEKLAEKPSEEDRIKSTTEDFHRLLTNIDTNLLNQADGVKLYEDLRKVAKRLLRMDFKYRCLDLNNPVVQQRLLFVEGVDAYLKYLGFETDEKKSKMICPENVPAKSVIKAAQEACIEFGKRAQEKADTLRMLRSASVSVQRLDPSKRESVQQPGTIEEEKAEFITEETVSDEFTLRDMVWSVTSPESRDEKTQEVLLLCHRAFADSIDMLRLLRERLLGNQTEDDEADEPEWNVQIKVGNMLRHWMKNFFQEDFDDQPEVLEATETLIEELEGADDAKMKKLVANLRKTFDSMCDEQEKLEYAAAHKPKKKIIEHLGGPTKFDFLETESKTIAEQITLMDFEIFKKIQARECLGQAWKKKNRNELAPNILAMIDQFNKISKWVQVLILTAPNIRARSKVLRKCIKVAGHLLDLRNFSSCCAFNSALISTPIHRLKAAWTTVPDKHMKAFHEIQSIFSMNRNWARLRQLHFEAHAPAILHTGLFLQDIVSIDEGNTDRKNGTINFQKLLRLFEKIDTIHMYQQAGYDIKKDEIFQKVLTEDFKKQQSLDDDHLFKFSTDVKQKDNKTK